ncbi:MAG: MOSC domain-containing protein [Casimicrobiaceae bacterium]
MPALRDMTQRFRSEGRIEAILLRPARLAPVVSVTEARAEPGRGLIGDRRSNASRKGAQAQKREITLFQAEHLQSVAAWCAIAALEPSRLRRNLVISGINLVSMRSPFADIRLEWRFGDEVLLEVTGSCEPCSRMEDELGPGGYNALRGHGGMTARVVVGGTVRVSDVVRLNPAPRLDNPNS